MAAQPRHRRFDCHVACPREQRSQPQSRIRRHTQCCARGHTARRSVYRRTLALSRSAQCAAPYDADSGQRQPDHQPSADDLARQSVPTHQRQKARHCPSIASRASPTRARTFPQCKRAQMGRDGMGWGLCRVSPSGSSHRRHSCIGADRSSDRPRQHPRAAEPGEGRGDREQQRLQRKHKRSRQTRTCALTSRACGLAFALSASVPALACQPA